MISLALLISVAATPAPEWPKVVDQLRAGDVSVARSYLTAHRDARGTMRMALIYRALEGLTAPPGSFTHRVSLEECTRMTEVLRRKPALLPELDCKAVVSWQQKLDEGWHSEMPAERRAIASMILNAGERLRDTIDAMLAVHANPKKYFAEIFGLPSSEGEKLVAQVVAARQLLFELLIEADALSTQSVGDCEEFVKRYPDHPFAASALFCAGHADRLRAQFPKHPLASTP